MSAVEVFQFPTTGQEIRTIVRDGEALFCLVDICRGLQHSNPSMAIKLVDEDDRVMVDTSKTDTPTLKRTSINPNIWFVTESGFYTLALTSQAPRAREFRRWVTHDVLPALRKTGRYEVEAAPPATLALPQSYAAALRELAATVEERDDALAELADAAPKAEAYEAFMDADGTYSVEQVAKMLHAETGLGRNRLFRKLRELDVLQDNNLPYQRHAQHFHVVASSFEHSDGRREITYTTRVRATGVGFIRRKLAGDAQLALVAKPKKQGRRAVTTT